MRYSSFHIDTSERKIVSFITAIITLLSSALIYLFCLKMGLNINSASGIEALGNIVMVPLVFVCFLASLSLNIASTASSIMAIFSSIKAIKVIAILLLILNLALLGLQVFTIFKILN